MKYPRILLVCSVCFALLLTAPIWTHAQSADHQNPVTDAVRAAFPAHQRNILEAFARMPEDKYNFRPTPEQLTFGELAVHIGRAQSFYCGMLASTPSERNPMPKPTASKDELIKMLRQTLDDCAGIVAEARDATAGEQLTVPSGAKRTRIYVLLQLVSGMDHHYGQAAGYLRLNRLVPPTADKMKK